MLHLALHSDEACEGISLATALSSECPPPLGFDSPITVCLDSNTDTALVSTCLFQQTLPTTTKLANNFENFRDNVMFGLLNHGGFGLL